jgi:hypothetical protein
MKKTIRNTILALALALFSSAAFAASHSAGVYNDTGNLLVVDSGGTLEVKSGGVITIDSGATVTNNAGETFGDATNIAVGTTTGTKFGTSALQKLGFYNTTPVVQQAATATATGFTAATGTAVLSQSTFTGNVGSAAYTLGDVVKALKNLGLMAQ